MKNAKNKKYRKSKYKQKHQDKCVFEISKRVNRLQGNKIQFLSYRFKSLNVSERHVNCVQTDASGSCFLNGLEPDAPVLEIEEGTSREAGSLSRRTSGQRGDLARNIHQIESWM